MAAGLARRPKLCTYRPYTLHVNTHKHTNSGRYMTYTEAHTEAQRHGLRGLRGRWPCVPCVCDGHRRPSRHWKGGGCYWCLSMSCWPFAGKEGSFALKLFQQCRPGCSRRWLSLAGAWTARTSGISGTTRCRRYLSLDVQSAPAGKTKRMPRHANKQLCAMTCLWHVCPP